MSSITDELAGDPIEVAAPAPTTEQQLNYDALMNAPAPSAPFVPGDRPLDQAFQALPRSANIDDRRGYRGMRERANMAIRDRANEVMAADFARREVEAESTDTIAAMQLMGETPQFPDIQDVAPDPAPADNFDGSDGAPVDDAAAATRRTLEMPVGGYPDDIAPPAPAATAVEQAPLPAPATTPAPAPSTPVQPPSPAQQVAPEDGQPQVPQGVSPNGVLTAVTPGGAGYDEYTRRLRIQESNGVVTAKAPTSSARGLYQFLDDTWGIAGRTRNGQPVGLANTPTGQAAGLRPINPADVGTPRDPRFDPAQQEIAIRLFTEQNAEALRRGGHPVNGRNLYLAHFMGSGGALRMLRLVRDNPDLPAATVFPDAAGANRNVFYTREGRARSVSEVYRLQTARFSDDAVVTERPQRRVTDPLGPADMSRPPAIELGRGYREGEQAAIRALRGEEQRSFFQLVGDAFQRETPEGALLRQGPAFTEEPGWATPANLKPYFDQIPAGFESRLSQAISPAHADWIVKKAKQDSVIDKAIEEAGWTGTGASVLASFLSPSVWAIGIASGGLGSLAAGSFRLGKAGSRLAGAAIGAAGNVAYEGAVAGISGDEYGAGEAFGAAITGAIFGAAFGPIGQNPATSAEALALARAARRHADDIIGGDQPAHVRGPAAAGAGVSADPNLPEVTDNPAWRALTDAAFQRGSGNAVADNLRISLGGQLAVSPNVGTRAVASGLVVDVVGKGAAVNHNTADQNMIMLAQRFQSQYLSVTDPAYREWAEEEGIGFFGRLIGRRREEFMNTIGRAILTATDDEIAQLPPSMQRVIKAHGTWVVERLNELQDPSLVFGPRQFRRGVPGSENLTPDARYMPVLWAEHKMQTALDRVGYNRLETFMAGAIKNVQTEIDDDLARRLAAAIIRGPKDRIAGADDAISRALAHADVEKLKTILKSDYDWEDKALESLVAQLSRSKPRVEGFLNRRIGMNYRAEMQLPDGSVLRMTDLMETNAEMLMMQYGRKHAGRMALANFKAVNPETGDVLFDGITSDADWAALLRLAENKARDTPGLDAMKAWAKEKDTLQYAYDRIRGRPNPAVEKLGQVADWMRFVRTFNFARVMNLMGLTSLADVGRSVGSVGIKAFTQQMGAYRRILDMDGRQVLKYGIDRELEAMFGLGTDALRGFKNQVMLDEFIHHGSDRLVDKANRAADLAAHITTKFSAQHAVQSWLDLVVGRAAAQRFADIAAKGTLSRAERNLVNFLGLDDAMLQRVLGEVRSNFSHETGALFGRRVVQMNMDKWADVEARAAFQQALFRYVRTTVQQNDVGSLHQVMSHPMAQLIFQFRSFSIVAHENQLLQGIAMADERQLGMALGTMLSGSLVYAVQTHLQALGRSDADSFLEEKGMKLRNDGDYGKLALATFQRAGFSGLIPMAVDSALMFTPMKPVFNARSTGNPSDIIFGNPTTSLVKNLAGTSRNVMDAFYNGRELTQPELRQAMTIPVWNNALGLSNILSLMISGRPE